MEVKDFAQSGINSGGAELLSTVSIHTEGSRNARMGACLEHFFKCKNTILGLKKTKKVTVSTLYRWGPGGDRRRLAGASRDGGRR